MFDLEDDAPKKDKQRDDDYPPRSGILPQYAHLKGIEENLPVIRKLLGMPPNGRLSTDTAIGRAVQRCIDNHSKNDVRES